MTSDKQQSWEQEEGRGRRFEGKGKSKFKREGGDGDPGVNNGWIDAGRPKCKIEEASRASGGISGD